MEREYQLERLKVPVGSPNGGQPSGDKSLEINLSVENYDKEVVYIFFSPDKPGIKFYDKTEELGTTKEKMRRTIGDGKYITDRDSISIAEWNENINGVNNDDRTAYGDIKITTIIVTEEKMKEIVDRIQKSTDPNRITIDTGKTIPHLYTERMERNNIMNIKTNNYNKFKQARENVIRTMEQQYDNNLNNIDKNDFNNIDISGKGLK